MKILAGVIAMFEHGAKIDDIMNILKPPTVDEDSDKKNCRISDTGIRYDSKVTPSEYNIRFEFAGQKNLEGLS